MDIKLSLNADQEMKDLVSVIKEISKPTFTKEEQVWLSTYVAVAASSNCTKSDTAKNWAGKAVIHFNEKFPKPTLEPQK
jgi:hypothetical protein